MNKSENIRRLNKFYMNIVLSIVICGTILSRINSNTYFVIAEIIFILLPCLFLIKEDRKEISIKTLHLGNVDFEEIIYSIIIPLFAYPLITIINSVFIIFLPSVDIRNIRPVYTQTLNEFILQVLFLALIPTICEELLFRSYFLQEYRKNGEIFAIIYVSFLFSLTHLNPYNFIAPFLLSLLLNKIAILTNSVTPSIIGHFINNLLAIFFMDLQIGIIAIRNQKIIFTSSGYELFMILAALIMACSLVLVFIFRRLNKKHQEEDLYLQDLNNFKHDLVESKFSFSTYKYVILIFGLFIISFISIYFG